MVAQKRLLLAAATAALLLLVAWGLSRGTEIDTTAVERSEMDRPALERVDTHLAGQTAPASLRSEGGIDQGSLEEGSSSEPSKPKSVAVVRDHTLVVDIEDHAGDPIEGARVFVAVDWSSDVYGLGFADLTLEDRRRHPLEVVEEGQGRYSAAVSIDEVHLVAVEASDFASAELRGCRAGVPVRFKLRPAARLAGLVRLKETKEPLAGMRVRAFAGEQRLWRDTTSAADGRFEFDGLEPGEGAYLALGGPAARTRYTETTLKAGETTFVTIDVDRGVSVFGRVLDADTGAAIQAAEVSAGLFLNGHVRVKSDGSFQLDGLTSAPSAIYARAPGYATGAGRRTEDDAPIDLYLVREIVLRGQAVDADGVPLTSAMAGVSFQIAMDGEERKAQGPFRRPQATTQSGRFELRRLHPTGACLVTIRAPGYARWTQQFKDLGTHALDGIVELGKVELAPATEFMGRLRWLDGTPVESASVVLAAASDDPTTRFAPEFRATTAHDGTFRVRELSEGRWTVRVVVDSVTRHIESVDVRGAMRFERTLNAGAGVSGIVTNEALEPIFNASVGLVPTDDESLNALVTSTDDSGRFEIANVPPGIYRLEANLEDFGRRGQPDQPLYRTWTSEPFQPDGRSIEIVLVEK